MALEDHPGLRLIEARCRLRLADLAIITAEAQTSVTESWAGSDRARDAYAELTDSARELVAAQEAFDAHCEAARVRKFGAALLGPQQGEETGDARTEI